MTKEQIAEARRLVDDMRMEPLHAGMNHAGEIMDRLLEEREALLDALRDMLICLEAHSVVEEVEEYVQRAEVAIAKAEAE